MLMSTSFINVLVCVVSLLTSVFGQFSVELFSDDRCTQPYDDFLSSNQMINDIHDWNNATIIPPSVIEPVRDNPGICVPRTVLNDTSRIIINGWTNFYCITPTSSEVGQLRIQEHWDGTNCSVPPVLPSPRMLWSTNMPPGSTGADCIPGSLLTNWANNTYITEAGGRNVGFYMWMKVSCGTTNDASTAALGASRMVVIGITIMTSLAILSSMTGMPWN